MRMNNCGADPAHHLISVPISASFVREYSRISKTTESSNYNLLKQGQPVDSHMMPIKYYLLLLDKRTWDNDTDD